MHINRYIEAQTASYNFRHSFGVSNGTKLKKKKKNHTHTHNVI